ncbi:hypothetical protein [Pectobacterium polaris]|uniref:hypothetical protein n=1 Tax=Pectobacterium polaris TaxID=2042057 RepID=UPI0020C62BB5|nr:hypothetical protein [Pectobacterium polaris]
MTTVTITKCTRPLKSVLCNQLLLVVTLVVLTEMEFRLSLLISQLLAKAIPVRGANLEKADVH